MEPFKLERYFAEHEFKTRYLLSASDCESLSVAELLALADDDGRRRWDGLRLGYTESQGDPMLRQEISRQYTATGPDDVIGLVPEEGIFLAMHSLLQAGQHVVAIQPAYQSLYEIARSLGGEVTPWPVQLGDDGWALDLDHLAGLIQPNTRLLVINFPHNPTGYLPPRELLEGIIQLARQHDLYVFSDEMYRLLERDPARRLPAVCDLYEKGVSLAGLSKTHALPGLRLGWLASRAPGLMARWLALKDYTTICHSAPSEALGLIGLRAGGQLLDRCRGLVETNIAHATAFFERYADLFRWVPPQAGSIAFPEWTGPGSLEALCQGVLDQQGVMVVPGSIFDYPGERFRLGLGRRNFPEALAAVEAYLAGR